MSRMGGVDVIINELNGSVKVIDLRVLRPARHIIGNFGDGSSIQLLALVRAPIVATWADRFSWCCWRRFS